MGLDKASAIEDKVAAAANVKEAAIGGMDAKRGKLRAGLVQWIDAEGNFIKRK